MLHPTESTFYRQLSFGIICTRSFCKDFRNSLNSLNSLIAAHVVDSKVKVSTLRING